MKKLLLICILLVLALPAHAATIGRVQSNNIGLVGHWTFDGADTPWTSATAGTVRDRSGNNYTGTLTNMSQSSAPAAGKVGQALKFTNANTQYIDLGNVLHLAANGSFTISAWVKPNAIGQNMIFSKANGFSYVGAEYAFFLQSNATYCLNISDGTVDTNPCGNTSYTAGQWQHLVVQYDSAAAKIYLYRNGIADGSANYTIGAPNSNAVAASIGALGTSYYFFDGSMDDLRVYSRVLPATEVKSLYNSGVANAAHSNSGSNAPLSSGLVGYWPLDGATTNWATGRTNDLSGQGNTGTLVSMSTTTSPVAGKIGQGLKFDGTTQYVNINDASSLDQSSSYTVSAWVNAKSLLTTDTAEWNSVVTKGQGGETSADNHNYLLGYNGASGFGTVNRWLFVLEDSGGTNCNLVGNSAASLNRWYHVVAVFDDVNDISRLYVDGIQQNTVACALTPNTNALPVRIGEDQSSAGIPLNGSIDDVRIYNRALSANEVKSLYNTGAANVAHSNTGTNAPLSTGLVGHWTFDGGATNWRTNTTADSSGNGNTGTLVGMSTTTSPTAGKIGSALKFDGVNDYMEMGDVLKFTSANSLTLTGWFNINLFQAHNFILSRENSLTRTDYSMSVTNSSTISYGYDDTTGINTVVFTDWTVPTFRAGEWHHVVMVIQNDATATAYFDGVSYGSQSAPHDDYVSTNLHIGTNHYDAGGSSRSYFNGKLDDVRIYNRALSAAEVKQLYLMGK